MTFIYLTVLFPLLGYLILAFSHGRWSDNLSSIVGISSIGLTTITTIFAILQFQVYKHIAFLPALWTWIKVDDFTIKVNFMLDSLALTMLSIVVIVGFLVHIFASWYMRGDNGYSRFFAYTNLFIANMIVLVLSDNFILMYLGWEGVGICSYMLIGFYYSKHQNNIAAIKAFIMTRIGDVLLAIGIFLIYNEFHTLNFNKLLEIVPLYFNNHTHDYILNWITLMILGGAVGKSAQLPLHTWLADAMVGPAPVSALIHAATMVTAGVYLIARTHFLFLLTPLVLNLVAIIGAITLILAAFSALVQTDIKRILAYSTMSQIGYMFLALGVKAWNAAIYHLMTHAFFKALLFLASGSLILSCHHEQNIFKMGGLRKKIPLIYLCFLAGGSALAAVPILTAGFYSKDQILCSLLANNHINLMIIGLLGTFLSSLYTFRMIFIIFHGKSQINAYTPSKHITHHLPLIILIIFSTFIGALIKPSLHDVFPLQKELDGNHKIILEVVSSIVILLGIMISSMLWLGKSWLLTYFTNNILGQYFKICSFKYWGFDYLYHQVFVKTYLYVACLLKHDPLNLLINLPVLLVCNISKLLVISINGYLRWYVASMSIGAIIILSLILFLGLI
ncbi:NADH-quinone oxidoreductase subunit L [Pantoea sp. Mhis]|uniref:NADH-quinone oxidoreductase subunit L n=1 Tax=Pantoea sp. Mhis TaxID=2576759 RepID=UPI0013597E59|nr:NADH-quinone oxidoreductase subunit L [Pantoea sp. Mhis]MXP56101.1 NADH-quinone oxidoreductase subunit L [Pantoea sp. Mhis]